MATEWPYEPQHSLAMLLLSIWLVLVLLCLLLYFCL